jgi:cob(I)alamin adenosyltransferase
VKIYTRTGDGGRTKLFGGVEVSKQDLRVDAYGTLDELNAVLGTVLALDRDDEFGIGALGTVQEDLFAIGSRLAAARPERELTRRTIPGLAVGRVGELEAWIDGLEEELPPLDAFILPGGCLAGAQLHVARTVCRRAERAVASLLEDDPSLSIEVVPYINRLSDLLFTLARAVNHRAGRSETEWTPMRRVDRTDTSPTPADIEDS